MDALEGSGLKRNRSCSLFEDTKCSQQGVWRASRSVRLLLSVSAASVLCLLCEGNAEVFPHQRDGLEMKRCNTWPGHLEDADPLSYLALRSKTLAEEVRGSRHLSHIGSQEGIKAVEGQTDSMFELPVGDKGQSGQDSDSKNSLGDVIHLMKNQEQALLLQAGRCRAAVRRLQTLDEIVRSTRSPDELPEKVAKEAGKWRQCALSMQDELAYFFSSTAKELASLLGEQEAPSGSPMFGGVQLQYLSDSNCTPDHHCEDDGLLQREKTAEGAIIATGQDAKKSRKLKIKAMHAVSLPVLSSMLPIRLEERFRVGTWHDVPIYGVEKQADGNFVYAAGTELHLVWDIDQTKLVGEGTNDVELVLKCVLWWKEELQHDMDFIPPGVDDQVRQEFIDYCANFNISEGFDNMMSYLSRPGIQEFVKAHPTAKWWTFTNKDRTVEGQIVRDVSDEDGLVGKYQEDPHEVSGRPVIDANKMALRLLDESADRYAGITAEERPLVGVRGQQKDLRRIAKLIDTKNKAEGKPNKPVTIVLLDDKDVDAYGFPQANEPRCHCLVPCYNAIEEKYGESLKKEMERILPVDTLLRFYKAFRGAEDSHALVQCVEIMSDDQSTLLKRKGTSKDPTFTYVPKVEPASYQPGPLPTFSPEKPK